MKDELVIRHGVNETYRMALKEMGCDDWEVGVIRGADHKHRNAYTDLVDTWQAAWRMRQMYVTGDRLGLCPFWDHFEDDMIKQGATLNCPYFEDFTQNALAEIWNCRAYVVESGLRMSREEAQAVRDLIITERCVYPSYWSNTYQAWVIDTDEEIYIVW